jgi:thiamine-phosphate pyrophosphorylase
MTNRQRALPRRWLMTDERMGDRLWTAIARLPDGESGIVFRHYATPAEDRRKLARQVAEVCRSRDIMLAIAGDSRLAEEVDSDLVHNPQELGALPFSISAHSLAEAVNARATGAALVFISPVHATRSHPGETALGPHRAADIARAAGVPAIALGGMDEAAFARLPAGVFHGWAGIDTWIGDEKL